MYVCTSCTVVSLSTTDVNSNRLPALWLKLIPQTSTLLLSSLFLCFNFLFSRFLGRNSTFLKNLNSFQHLSMFLLCPLSLACGSSSVLVPFYVAHNQNIFCTRSELLPAYLFSLCRVSPYAASHAPICANFGKYFGPVHCPCILYSLLLPSILVGLNTPLRSMPRYFLFLSTTVHFSSG